VATVTGGEDMADLTGVVMKTRKEDVSDDDGMLPPLAAALFPAAAALAALGLLAARDQLRSLSGDRDSFVFPPPPPSPISPYEQLPTWSRYLQSHEVLAPAVVVSAEERGLSAA